jgi:glycosyltransferase involved in cell wall biosynthesis/2-polyprenyl-3-methyl-5-hydroxy-6-metoxy-1,4-benzoquinol methylase
MNACTIIARNYLAQARVLARSFFEHHPEGRFSVLVIDAETPVVLGAEDRFRVLLPLQIGFEEAEFHRLATIYDVMELATAVKPQLLKFLLAEGSTAVTYFDPDIEIFQPLDDIEELARKHSIVLTPHTLEPLPHDRREPGEVTLLLAGMFNLGFIAVGASAGSFLDWWAERVARDCRVAPDQGQFVDQRWIDFVPSLFDHHVLRDPGCNVAHWNLETRTFEWTSNEYRVDGQPLRFFHYSGFDPEKAHILSKFLGPSPTILLSEEPALARICQEYAAKLFGAGYRESSEQPYALETLPTGLPLDRRIRRLYHEALVIAENDGGAEPPDPFAAETSHAFVEWLREPAHAGGHEAVSRYALALFRERRDLQTAFPDPRWHDAERFVEWLITTGRHEEKIPFELVPEPRALERARATRSLTPGVNVAGYFRAEVGVGEAARHLIAAIESSGIPFETVTYSRTPSRQEHLFSEQASSAARFDTNVICVNADQLSTFAYDMGPEFFAGRYSAGLWWWEVAEFPESLHAAFDTIDEVWVGSDFTRVAVAASTEKPVLTIPLGLEVSDDAPLERRSLGLPEGFLFYFTFDFFSVFERKNPIGVVEAFKRAFAPNEGPTLLLKSVNGDQRILDLERLRAAVADRPDIVLLDKYLSSSEKNALMASCDCYISLHRSEGLGLTIAEAMARGKPVIATGYSGNLTFMNESNSYLVRHTMAPIPAGCDPYPQGVLWADPDLDDASRLMRIVYEHQNEAAKTGRNAREDILARHSPSKTATFIKERLVQIRELRAAEAAEAESYAAQPSAVDRTADYIANEPQRTLQAPSRFGFFGRFARRVLYRVLRPHIVPQRIFEAEVVHALRDNEAVVAQARAELDELERGQQNLQAATIGAQDAIQRQLERLERLESTLSANLSALETHLAAVVEDSSRHLHALEDRVAKTEGRGGFLWESAHAPPYVSNRKLFETTDSAGRRVLGYSDGSDPVSSDAVYRRFEDVFRGSESFIRERQRAYLELLRDHAPILDVGCGRGEFLDLLSEEGIAAKGVDVDSGMVERCREKGHEVELADGLEYLAGLADRSLGGIFSAQVVEHLPYEALIQLFALARAKLDVRGVLIVETVNPHSVGALKNFWVDPTHTAPVFPEVALLLSRLNGFGAARVVFPNGTGDLERDLREQGEYATVATVSTSEGGQEGRS